MFGRLWQGLGRGERMASRKQREKERMDRREKNIRAREKPRKKCISRQQQKENEESWDKWKRDRKYRHWWLYKFRYFCASIFIPFCTYFFLICLIHILRKGHGFVFICILFQPSQGLLLTLWHERLVCSLVGRDLEMLMSLRKFRMQLILLTKLVWSSLYLNPSRVHSSLIPP